MFDGPRMTGKPICWIDFSLFFKVTGIGVVSGARFQVSLACPDSEWLDLRCNSGNISGRSDADLIQWRCKSTIIPRENREVAFLRHKFLVVPFGLAVSLIAGCADLKTETNARLDKAVETLLGAIRAHDDSAILALAANPQTFVENGRLRDDVAEFL